MSGRDGDLMTTEQQCIKELYGLLERIEYGARHHDLTLLRVPRGATGCDMFQGMPPISRLMVDIADRHRDILFPLQEEDGMTEGEIKSYKEMLQSNSEDTGINICDFIKE